MKNFSLNRKGILSTLSLALVCSSAFANNKVVTLSNQTSGNSLQVFSVKNDGSLTATETIPTGGIGTGAGLGSQGAVTFDPETEMLAAVNAGDGTVSLFSTRSNRIKLVTRFSSMGVRPVSVTLRRRTLYVLNQGNATNPSGIQGFRVNNSQATPIVGGASGLSATYTNPAQISFSPNGENLVVTEKGTNKIGVFGVNKQGVLQGSFYSNSSGATPFGFAFDRRGHLFVTEAFGGASGASAVSSYSRANNGFLNTISASVPTTQTAACWAVVSPNNRFVFSSNAASGTISTFDISSQGLITLAANSTPIAGATAVDMSISENGRSLYLLAAGIPGIVSYRIDSAGLLTRFDTDTVLSGSVGVAFIDED